MKSLKLTIYLQILLLILVTSSVSTIVSIFTAINDIDTHLMTETENISIRTAKSLAFPFWNHYHPIKA